MRLASLFFPASLPFVSPRRRRRRRVETRRSRAGSKKLRSPRTTTTTTTTTTSDCGTRTTMRWISCAVTVTWSERANDGYGYYSTGLANG